MRGEEVKLYTVDIKGEKRKGSKNGINMEKREELFNSKRSKYIQNKSKLIFTNFNHFEMNPIEKDKTEELHPAGMGNEKKEDQLSPLAIAIQNDSILGNVISFLNVFIQLNELIYRFLSW